MDMREKVRRNYVYILNHLDVVRLTDYLYQELVLTSEDHAKISSKNPNLIQQCRELLAILSRKGDAAYETFFKWLSSGDESQRHLRRVLDGNTASPFHCHEPTRLLPVTRPKLRMHPGLANKQYCTINLEGRLENRPSKQWSWGNLLQYRGTTSTHSLNYNNDVQYWETCTAVRMTSGVLESGDFILEMGIAEEGSVDSNHNVTVNPRYWRVAVSCCYLHRPRICTSVWQQGRLVVCYPISRHHTPETQRLFCFGIALDISKGRIVFIDVARQVVIAVLHTQFRQPLFPMFGVSVRQYYGAVTMELISGNDINMTERKRWLISDAMSH